MKVAVQKFGGGCVEPENEHLTAERIMEAKDADLMPVVVISAMGRKGNPYSSPDLYELAYRISPRIEPRELDLLMSCGEIISTARMAHLLHSKGYDTVALTGGQAGLITDAYYNHARIIEIQAEYILRALDSGKMVFVAGFQGVTAHHAITTLGEGGSDYTAVALAVMLQQTPRSPIGEEIDIAPLHIYKQVDGVMTANPKLFEGAATKPRNIPTLSYEEMVVMSRLGADVVQDKAAQMAHKHHLPVQVRNYEHEGGAFTDISRSVARSHQREVTGVADMGPLRVFVVHDSDPRAGKRVAEFLERDRFNFYTLPIEDEGFQVAVKPEKYRDVRGMIAHIFRDREIPFDFVSEEFGLVSMVGEGMSGRLEALRAQALETLRGGSIEVEVVLEESMSLSFLVPEGQRRDAVFGLHQRFIEEAPAPGKPGE
jgi:aspartate kinase